jgi:sucrose-6-phosphate hydrolase SacC (GH32 family)
MRCSVIVVLLGILAARTAWPAQEDIVNVDQVVRSNERRQEEIMTDELYHETYRPQFHFTPRKNWANDPNGLVCYKGEYHLFFQHNPFGIEWGNMHWGHAVSKDLVHWEELPIALAPDEHGTCFSGSAVVDWNNSAGFQTGDEKVLVAVYTGAPVPKVEGGPKFTQCIAYSNDRGRTWTKYDKNPVLPHLIGDNRDPKVIWYDPARHWIMALYKDGNDYALFSSPDLKQWTHRSDIHMPGCGECPDLFELPVDSSPQDTRWVFVGGNGNYMLGRFDGKLFAPGTGVLQADWGANFYATQTYSDIPKDDGRRIQIAWMNGGKYPGMPFNQQMTFSCELTLRAFPEGIRLCRNPVKEIEVLHDKEHAWRDLTVKPGENPLSAIEGELFDIRAEIDPGDAVEFGLKIRGETIRYAVKEKRLSCLGKQVELEPVANRIRLQVLVDRASLEVFGNGGKVSMSSCFLPRKKENRLEVYTSGGSITLAALHVYTLRRVDLS